MLNGYLGTLLNDMNISNFVFLGEAGCGKTEIAINFAMMAAQDDQRDTAMDIHFFDMDQTKPLFRSRDVRTALEDAGVIFHYEEQFGDARTMVGGTNVFLQDTESVVIIDVGGDHQGSRMVGGFAPLLKREDTKNFFVINPFRPWSASIEAIDRTMAGVLGMANLDLENIEIMSNPNMGMTTTADEVIQGHEKIKEMINEYIKVKSLCVMKELAGEIEGKVKEPVIPLGLYMTKFLEVI